jgi:hypothetical protein
MALSISSNNILHKLPDCTSTGSSSDQDRKEGFGFLSKKNIERVSNRSNTVSHNNNTETWKKIGILALFIIGTAAIFAGLAFSGGAPLIAIPIIGLGLIGASVLGYYFRSVGSGAEDTDSVGSGAEDTDSVGSGSFFNRSSIGDDNAAKDDNHSIVSGITEE